MPEAVGCESRCHIDVVRGSIILFFGFGGRDVADGLKQAAMVEPIDPLGRRVFDRLKAAPRATPVDHLSLVESVDRLGQSVVIAVADAADRGLDSGLGKSLTVFDRDVLATAIEVMDETAAARRSAIVKGLLEGVENEASMGGPARSPSDDPPGERIDDEGDVDEPGPGREWSRKRMSASPPRTVRAPFSAYGSLFNLGPRPWRHHDSEK